MGASTDGRGLTERDAAALPDLSADAPAGENVELDPDYLALNRAVQGRPETEYGDPPVPPDWKEARALADSLLRRTRDLRVLTHLAVARLHLDGVAGFGETLAQIRDQVEARWEAVHPWLDPEDDRDPTWRRNALADLASAGSVMRTLRDVTVAAAREGPLQWRDVATFLGQTSADQAGRRVSEAAIRGAFVATPAARVAALREAVARALAEARAIPVAFEAHAGRGTGPALEPLQKLLSEMDQGLGRFQAAPTEATEPAPEPGEDIAPGAVDAPPPREAFTLRSISAVSRREDALYLLDLAAAYFRANEPSSPLPLLIDRARRLAGMEFLDILRDLAPNGLGQAQVIVGPLSGE